MNPIKALSLSLLILLLASGCKKSIASKVAGRYIGSTTCGGPDSSFTYNDTANVVFADDNTIGIRGVDLIYQGNNEFTGTNLSAQFSDNYTRLSLNTHISAGMNCTFDGHK